MDKTIKLWDPFERKAEVCRTQKEESQRGLYNAKRKGCGQLFALEGTTIAGTSTPSSIT
jgi:hypothetical protein